MTTRRRTFRPRTGNRRGAPPLRLHFARESHGVPTPGHHSLGAALPYPVPPTLTPGTYRVTVGVFSADWATLYIWDNQAATFVVQYGQARDYSWSFAVPTALPAGTYTFKVGIFSSDWSTLHLWVNNAATFVVQ